MKLTTLALLACGFATAATADDMTVIGKVDHVRDGDTIEVRGVAIRLNGVDAPELGDANGTHARAAMIEITNGRRIECELTGAKTYDRMVGSCYLADGEFAGADIGLILISNGYALDCARYSGGAYAAYETEGARMTQARAPYCGGN